MCLRGARRYVVCLGGGGLGGTLCVSGGARRYVVCLGGG